MTDTPQARFHHRRPTSRKGPADEAAWRSNGVPEPAYRCGSHRPHRAGKDRTPEKIAAFGSISAAGRAMGMSYRRAWELIEEINGMFGKPVIDRKAGGRHGGGVQLTTAGLALVTRFRAIERAAAEAAGVHLSALQAEVAQGVVAGRTEPPAQDG